MRQHEAAKEIIPKESDEMQALMRYCSVELSRRPELDMLVHTPNEGKRTRATGGRLKSEGLRKGFPDLSLHVQRCGCGGLFIELKRRKKYSISPEQRQWIVKLINQGYAALFCFGWEEAWKAIEYYLDDKTQNLEAMICRSLKRAGVEVG